jgi:hypothetical protein
VAEGEEAVVGVFDVEGVIGPVAMESTVGGPEAIDEVEEGVFEVGEGGLGTVEGVEGDGGGEEVRDGGVGEGFEAAGWVELAEEP